MLSLILLELGAGSGHFAFLFLRALESIAGRDAQRVRYVMTDVADSTIRFWRQHDALTPFVRAGLLDFARFDAEHDRALHLERTTIAPGTPARRLVVIANYVFSGLRHDAFVVGAGRIREYLTQRTGANVTAPYPDSELNATLEAYAAAPRAGRVLLPIGSLRCLERLRALAADDMLVLAADRGTTDAADARALGADLEIARHGSVSFPVNFHALRAWIAARGGRALRPSRRHRHVHLAGFMLGTSRRGWQATRSAFEQVTAAGGPDALYAIRRGLATVKQLRPTDFLALMRRCGPDPRVVAECVRPLWRDLDDADAKIRGEIRKVVVATWPNYYHLGEAHDVPFTLGLLLYEVRAYADARMLFAASARLYGNDAATWWNLALCDVALGNATAARTALRRARALSRALPPAGLALRKSSALAGGWT